MADGNGNIQFTAKELIVEVNGKLDKVLDKLDNKVDRPEFAAVTARVSDLELHGSRQAIEALADLRSLEGRIAKIEAPNPTRLIEEFREYQRRQDRHGERLQRLENGIGSTVKEAIEKNNILLQEQKTRSLSKTQKVFVIGGVIISALGTFVSIAVLLYH